MRRRDALDGTAVTPRETAFGVAIIVLLVLGLMVSSWDGFKALDRPTAPANHDAVTGCEYAINRTPAHLPIPSFLGWSHEDTLICEAVGPGPIQARGSLAGYLAFWSGGRLFVLIPAESIEVVP